MLFYRAALPLSSRTLTFVAGIIRRYRISIGSCWRKLNPGQQSLLVLVYLRKGEAFAELAAGFAVGVTTAWRYVNETADLLAARVPKLRQAVRAATKAGYAYVVLDGTVIPVGPGCRGPALLLAGGGTSPAARPAIRARADSGIRTARCLIQETLRAAADLTAGLVRRWR